MEEKNTRYLEFKVWCVRSELFLVQFAEALGMSRSRFCTVMKADEATPAMRKRLLEVGIPEEFLPQEYEPRKAGRKRMIQPLLDSVIEDDAGRAFQQEECAHA